MDLELGYFEPIIDNNLNISIKIFLNTLSLMQRGDWSFVFDLTVPNVQI